MERTVHPAARPAIALGLTFLLIGLSYALPLHLLPESAGNLMPGHLPPEVINVYACVAWAGWAHFIYAFRGQAYGLKRSHAGARRELLFAAAVAASLAILLGFRSALGITLFGAIVWAYFIDHFMKAERIFENTSASSEKLLTRWLASYRPVLAFAWLSVILLNIGDIDSRRWALIAGSVSVALLVLVAGGWRELRTGDVRGPLLSLFFVGEALVWGTFSVYAGPVFRTGVYVFHIAAASYFHYIGSYIYAFERSSGADRWITPLAIVGVNLAIVAVGCAAGRFESLSWLAPVIGIQWFTLWVGLHLVSSDLLPAFKKRPTSTSA